MGNKIDIILKKLINEELDRINDLSLIWNYKEDNKKWFSNKFGVDVANSLESEDTARVAVEELSNYIQKKGDMRDIAVNNLYLLTLDVLKHFNETYKYQPTVIKMLFVNANKLGIK